MNKNNTVSTEQTDPTLLRRGWTTGACATAASAAAYTALLTGRFPDPITITLPGGQRPDFALALEGIGTDWTMAGVVKDAGDDPDVTHEALIMATIRSGPKGAGVRFFAGEGVGMVTLPGLPIPPGEPAINPAPRKMMRMHIAEIAAENGSSGDVDIIIAVQDGAILATQTWNSRLGIEGGLSILGTTGIVKPFSCAAWIHAIHRGVDVARANGWNHIGAATGSTSEASLRREYDLPLEAMIDMGDFAGGLLKYLRRHPVARLTLAGGFAKLVKLGQGHLDLHSGRSQVDFSWLAMQLAVIGADTSLCNWTRTARSANQVLTQAQSAGFLLGDTVAAQAQITVHNILKGTGMVVDILVVDRAGMIIGRTRSD